MLKYDKLKVRNPPDSLLSLLLAGVQFILVMTGLVGISVELFREKGWLKQALSSLMQASMTSLVIGVPFAILVFLVGRAWLISHSERHESSRTADLMLYAMMAVGGWFLYKLVTQGSF
jgi:uncharacterized membrane protein YqjE